MFLFVHEWRPERFKNLGYGLMLVCGLSSIIVWIGFLFFEANIASFIAGSVVRDVERYPLILTPLLASLGLIARSFYVAVSNLRTSSHNDGKHKNL